MSETKNELEDLLEKAATEPAHRPAFFRTLLESTVWVPGTAAQGEAVVEERKLSHRDVTAQGNGTDRKWPQGYLLYAEC